MYRSMNVLRTLQFIAVGASCLLMGPLFGTLVAQTPPEAGARKTILPSLTGPDAVGRTSFDWVDSLKSNGRSTPNVDGGDAKDREIIVWAWYPATKIPSARQPAT